MLGLPGSGKSSFIMEHYSRSKGYALVSADELRVNHPNYNPEHPEAIHEQCVKEAEDLMYQYGINNVRNIVMDGGGINNSYTVRIIKKMKEFGYKTKVVFVDTPAHICIKRNNERIQNGQRFVPTEAIIDKSYKLLKSVQMLSAVCDEFITIPYFTDEYIFVDMDGTIAEYQNLPVDQDGDINFVGYGVFKYSKPVIPVIEKLRELQSKGKEVSVLSASPNNICINEKNEWLDVHAHFIEHRYFVGNRHFKHTFLKHLMLSLNIKPNQCTIVDDDHVILKLYESIGVNTVHPSKLLSSY